MSSVVTKEDTAKSLIALGKEADAAGNREDAIQLYSAAIVLDKTNPSPYKLRGDCFFNLKQHASALESYDQALLLRPNAVLALYNRAMTNKALLRFDAALADLDALLAVDKDHFHARASRGDLLIEFGRFEDAKADYDEAVRINPGSSSVVYRQARAALLHRSGPEDRRAIFEQIYNEGAWGKSSDPSDRYFSGVGTRETRHADSYVRAVSDFLQSFSPRLSAVDLGCGDFEIGSRVRGLCGAYVACDVVAGLIQHNKEKFADLDVDFRVLDAVNDALPDGDVVFIREVLQHLSNKDIAAIVAKVRKQYRYAVVTESVPASEAFVANLDQVTGYRIRIGVNGSGVVLTQPPFDLNPKDERQLCASLAGSTKIVTTLYSF